MQGKACEPSGGDLFAVRSTLGGAPLGRNLRHAYGSDRVKR